MNNPATIAIIGGGPSGLVALKSALEDGLDAFLFEQSADTGGQWSRFPGRSGVWDSLSTNSSKYVTVFSDWDHEPDTELYPKHTVIREYLDRYRDHFGLDDHIRLNTTVHALDRAAGGGYTLSYSPAGEEARIAHFHRVIVATGRFNKPHRPVLPGLDLFKASVSHAFDYRSSARLENKTVLVIGTRITGAELAAELSLNEKVTVISSCRKPKYVLTKVINGEPGDHHLFTRFRGLAATAFPPEAGAQRLKEWVLNTCGNPVDYGGLQPADNIFEAGITASDHYLDQVKKGRIIPKPNVSSFKANSVIFEDGTELAIDEVIFATGYDLHVPFLSPGLLAMVNSGDQHLDLYKYTFHPELPGLAFIGMFMQIGALFPSLELQARWIAGCWSGHLALPAPEDMCIWIEIFKNTKGRGMLMAQETSVLFATAAGLEPELDRYPELAGALLFGPLAPAQFRLQGHGKRADAEASYRRNNAFTANSIHELTEQQLGQLRALAGALPANGPLSRLADKL
jgi:dimethylaniline monooxygenase (N-oxide forming)